MAERATRNGTAGHYEKLDKEKIVAILEQAVPA